ncbi:MAG TPA: alpha/beta fold hydrolase [Allosphingosinicella sp.]|jgi:pimeloyl-ACP methyl ester carboxylesterase
MDLRAPCLALPLLLIQAGSAGAAEMAARPAAKPCSVARPVDEAGFVAIGGIEQWVTVRGDSCANPVVLFLHGGPGNPLSPYGATIYAAWEKHFTLVQWDQRGAGRTFARNPPPAALTVEGMAKDGIAVAEHLRARLGQERIILVGGSWGSVLGVHMALARPDLFHAYVGAGQLVRYPENLAASYSRLLERARAGGDGETIARIEALGPPPWTDPRSAGILRRSTRAYERRSTVPAPAGWWSPAAAYADPASREALEGGDDFSYLQFVGADGRGMASTIDLPKLGLEFAIPVYLVQGEEDLVTVPSVARSYFDSLSAPAKAFRLLEGTGHDPNAAMVEAQLDILRTRVLPRIR